MSHPPSSSRDVRVKNHQTPSRAAVETRWSADWYIFYFIFHFKYEADWLPAASFDLFRYTAEMTHLVLDAALRMLHTLLYRAGQSNQTVVDLEPASPSPEAAAAPWGAKYGERLLNQNIPHVSSVGRNQQRLHYWLGSAGQRASERVESAPSA